MNIGQLYQLLDWSNADRLADKWLGEHPSEHETPDDFIYRWRLTLLDEALDPDNEPARRQEAQMWLAQAGVWSQVVAILQHQPT